MSKPSNNNQPKWEEYVFIFYEDKFLPTYGFLLERMKQTIEANSMDVYRYGIKQKGSNKYAVSLYEEGGSYTIEFYISRDTDNKGITVSDIKKE